MKYGRGWAAALLASALVLGAACTSETSDDDSTADTDDTAAETGDDAEGTVDAPGITDDTIRISLISSDLSALSEQNLAPEIGLADKTLAAVVADINANGGVLGRQIELVPHVIAGADAAINPEAGRQACVQATQDDKPFAVIIAAAITAETVECAAQYEDVLTITMDSWPDSYYETAQGRLFSVATHLSAGRNRLYTAWPKILDDRGELEGATIGIIRMDRPEQEEAAADALIPSIEALGYEVAAEFALPCPEGTQTCEQHDVAIQRMKDAGVDLVFLTAQTLVGSATVQAAADLDFTPQWTTIGNNVTDTVARFYVNAKDNYDGALGIDAAFAEATDATVECNEIAVAGGAEEFEAGSDGYLYTAVTCIQLQTLVAAIEAAGEAGDVTQASVIAAFETLVPVVSAGPEASLGPDKHDAGDYVFVSVYDASVEEWVPADDGTPIKVE